MQLQSEPETLALGEKIARRCHPPLIIYLQGDLGSGKTTFARGFIQALGYLDKVTSPTFSLVETYQFENVTVYHFDLYRIRDPQELEFIGLRDLSTEDNAICLIEWPERGGTELPAADLIIHFSHQSHSRQADLDPQTQQGQLIIKEL